MDSSSSEPHTILLPRHPLGEHTQSHSPLAGTTRDDKHTPINSPASLWPNSSHSIMPGLNQATVYAKPDVKPIISQKGMLVVSNYSPSEGEGGVPIAVDVQLFWPENPGDGEFPPMKLRLVTGRTAIPTFVQRLNLPNSESNDGHPSKRSVTRLRATANVPDYAGTRYLEHTSVPLTLQAVSPSPPNDVLDQVIFGTFTYWGPPAEYPTTQLIGFKRPREFEDSTQDVGRPTPSPPDREVLTANPSSLALRRPDLEVGLVRTTSVSRNLAGVVEARLEWDVTDELLHPREIGLQKNWTPKEHTAGRRLVRFQRWQVGGIIHLSCEPIDQDDFDENDIVVSCIYRRETRSCYFTSVDVIYLLERIVGEGFTVEEKNRIRRNLEGFKPITIAKHRVGCDRFFQKIMDFPAPKPRNIEKDVKVFNWDVLPDALEKIISKYSVVPVESTPKIESHDSSAGSSPAYTVPASNASETPQPQEELLPPAYMQTAEIPSPRQNEDSSFDGQLLYPPTAEDLWHRRDSITPSPAVDSHDYNSQAHSFAPMIQEPYSHGYLNMPSNISLSELSLASGHHGVPGGNYELNRSFNHAAAMDSSMISNASGPYEFNFNDYNSRRNSVGDSARPSTALVGDALAQLHPDTGLPRFEESNDLYSTNMNYLFDESHFVDYPLA